MNNALNARRQRSDGTFTTTTPEWDAKWYWPVGTRVAVPVRVHNERVIELGTITKANAVSATVSFDAGWTAPRVPVATLTRLQEAR